MLDILNSLLMPVYAQVPSSGTLLVGKNVGGINSLKTLFTFLTNLTIIIGVLLVVVFLVLAGIQYMTAKGDVKQAGEARQALTNAIIGFVVVIVAVTIRTVVLNVLGVNLDSSILP